jgi:hypothetical protein
MPPKLGALLAVLLTVTGCADEDEPEDAALPDKDCDPLEVLTVTLAVKGDIPLTKPADTHPFTWLEGAQIGVTPFMARLANMVPGDH